MSDTPGPLTTPPDPAAGPSWTPSPEPTPRRRRVGTVALVAGGLIAGGVLGGTLSATAANLGSDGGAEVGTATAEELGGSSRGYGTPAPPSGEVRDESQSQRSDETLLEGDVAAKVEAAALAEYPDATVLRVETDSDGLYEAHLVTADGERVTVEVGADFAVTGVEEMGAGGHPGGSGAGGPMGGGDGSTGPDGSTLPEGMTSLDGSGGTSGQSSALTS